LDIELPPATYRKKCLIYEEIQLATRFLPSITCRKSRIYAEILEIDDFISRSIKRKLLNIWGDLRGNEDLTFYNIQGKTGIYERYVDI
jgi:hypothetical protein